MPIGKEALDFIENHRVTYVVEQNRDAQMMGILQLETPEHATRIKSVLHYNGFPLHAATVVDQIMELESKEQKA